MTFNDNPYVGLPDEDPTFGDRVRWWLDRHTPLYIGQDWRFWSFGTRALAFTLFVGHYWSVSFGVGPVREVYPELSRHAHGFTSRMALGRGRVWKCW